LYGPNGPKTFIMIFPSCRMYSSRIMSMTLNVEYFILFSYVLSFVYIDCAAQIFNAFVNL
jgi:hypothetical protein